MKKVKVFISFDYDHDLEIKNALVAQADLDDSPFEINDISIKQAIDSNWKAYARRKIRESEVVIFLCGHYTDVAAGVSAEMSIAQEESKDYFLLCGRKNGVIKKPRNAMASDKIYRWTWDNLKMLVQGAR